MLLTLNCNTDFKVKVDFKSVQERYKWMQKPFDRGDKKHAQLSGVGGGITEEVELLSSMREGRTEMTLNINLGKDEVKKREQCKIAAGERLVTNSIMHATQSAITGSYIDIDDTSIPSSQQKRLKLSNEHD